ncbi:MAG: Hsp20/alpha crystallin family protein [Desulfobacterota bacterium]|nr:Hsp20/alpha crystallin family protein [Thermodesulfobacteriota bacterium]
MDRLWDSFFERGVRRKTDEAGDWFPTLDVSETKDDLVIKAEVPGLEPKDIDISLSDGVLTIKGEKKEEREEKEEDYYLMERCYGSFARSIQLPKRVQSDKIQATYKNGLLKIVLPKSEEAKKKEIKIQVQ